jgi:hypothetical protein
MVPCWCPEESPGGPDESARDGRRGNAGRDHHLEPALTGVGRAPVALAIAW